MLLEKEAKLKGNGALVLASQDGRLNMVTFLLQKCADAAEIGLVDDYEMRWAQGGGSAFNLINKGRADILDVLVKNGRI